MSGIGTQAITFVFFGILTQRPAGYCLLRLNEPSWNRWGISRYKAPRPLYPEEFLSEATNTLYGRHGNNICQGSSSTPRPARGWPLLSTHPYKERSMSPHRKKGDILSCPRRSQELTILKDMVSFYAGLSNKTTRLVYSRIRLLSEQPAVLLSCDDLIQAVGAKRVIFCAVFLPDGKIEHFRKIRQGMFLKLRKRVSC